MTYDGTYKIIEDDKFTTTTGFCIAEVHFDAGNSGGESDTSDYLEPMSDKDSKKINSRESNVIGDFCIAEVNFDVGNMEGNSESDKDSNEKDSDEKQYSATGGFCIAEVNFDVQNIEAFFASSNYSQPNTETERKEEDMPIAVSTGLCIAEMNVDIQNMETLSDTTEPTESSFRTLGLQGEESRNETYEKLQNAADTKVNTPNLKGLNEHPIPGKVMSVSSFVLRI